MLIFLMYVLMITFVFMAMRESDFVETWQLAYRLAYGDFEEEYPGHYERILFFGSTIYLQLILFNMVIALMGELFGDAKATAERDDVMEKINWVMQLQYLAFWDTGPEFVYLHKIEDLYMKDESESIEVQKIKELKLMLETERQAAIVREQQIEKNMNDKFTELSNEIKSGQSEILRLWGADAN